MGPQDLPFVDQHEETIAADRDAVWQALLSTLDQTLSRRGAAAYARAVRSSDPAASGPRPLAVGSTLPGFRVTTATPGSELVLEGRHLFSAYAMILRLDPVGTGRCRLRAETRATFAGPQGAVYRTLVIGTRGHALAMRRLLQGVRRRAENSPQSRGE
jgi:hypothetical protein